MALAYKSYVLLFRDRPKEVVDLFEKNKVIIQNQIEPALLFNTAESYFRVGDYEKAIKLFDKYILGNSFNPKSSFARVRLALSYEILDKDIKLILELYKNAINRASTPEARYEAKLRYVAVLLARKSEITEKDKESLVFLEHDVDETKALTQNLKHLLWIVRLRTLINQEKFDESLAYLTGIPLDSLRPAERRTFEGDGAEIVYGLISKLYQKGDYPKLLKVWETYSAKYVDKVAMDPQINFIICSSYLRMKLYESFERALTKFNDLSVTVPRSFPIWVERGETNNQSSLIKELAVLKSIYAKNWDQALVDLKKIDENELKNEKIKYYRGIIHYNKKEYQLGLDDIERFLVKYDKNRALPDEELSQLLEAYYESLYALGRIDKFETVVIALIKDLEEKTDKTPFLMECLERMTYLLIETLSSDSDKKNDSDIAGYINDFQKTFPKSVYDGRIRFLQAQNFIKFNKMDEGLSIFNKLLDDNTVPTYIKELTRTELSSIQLQNRSI